MADAIRFPGVYIEERGHDVPDIIGVATSTGLFVGWNGRGPLDEAVRDRRVLGQTATRSVPALAHAPTLASLQAECRRRRAFLIIDAPPTTTVGRMASEGTVGLDGQDASFAAIYFPWVRANDPAQGGVERDFPPCGGIAGVMARVRNGSTFPCAAWRCSSRKALPVARVGRRSSRMAKRCGQNFGWPSAGSCTIFFARGLSRAAARVTPFSSNAMPRP